MNLEVSCGTPLLDKLDINLNDLYVKVVGEIDENLAMKFCQELLVLDKKNLPFIPVMIQSSGGDVDALLVMISALEQCSTPVATIIYGSCCSAAAVLFALGTNGHRYMAPTSFLMFHESSAGLEGKGSDLQSCLTNINKIDKILNTKVEKHIGLEKNFFEQQSVDYYLTASEAYKTGIANVIGYPTFKFCFSLQVDVDVKKSRRCEEINRKNKYFKLITSQGEASNESKT